MQNTVEFAVDLDDTPSAADTFVVVDNAVAHTAAAADTDIVAVAGNAAAAAAVAVAVAHSTVALDTAGSVVGAEFVGAYSHPCMHGLHL